MKVIMMKDLVGTFAEDKDKAREIRLNTISPSVKDGEELILDFDGITSATQSFIHALISELIRTYGSEIFDIVLFKNCSENVRKVIEMVADYMAESI